MIPNTPEAFWLWFNTGSPSPALQYLRLFYAQLQIEQTHPETNVIDDDVFHGLDQQVPEEDSEAFNLGIDRVKAIFGIDVGTVSLSEEVRAHNGVTLPAPEQYGVQATEDQINRGTTITEA